MAVGLGRRLEWAGTCWKQLATSISLGDNSGRTLREDRQAGLRAASFFRLTQRGFIMAARRARGLEFVCLIVGLSAMPLLAQEKAGEGQTAPATDRVEFPRDYAMWFHVLRRVERAEKQQIVTVYGNDRASSVKAGGDLPYPYGSVIVMETAGALKDEQGNARRDEKGHLLRGDVAGLHVMRREKGFGEAYGKHRSGEWEYVEYRADGSYITPPRKSFACAECHVKAGADRDFVYRGRLPEKESK
jgi:hypothetical protein